MELPIIVDRKPVRVTLEAGETYAWCSCGKSKKQPFCDGSHSATPYKPVVFKQEVNEEAHLCLCKRSGKTPLCDGTHARLDASGNLPEGDGENQAMPAPIPSRSRGPG